MAFTNLMANLLFFFLKSKLIHKKTESDHLIVVTDKDNQYVINIGSQIVCCDKEEIITLLDSLIERDNNYKELLEDYLS